MQTSKITSYIYKVLNLRVVKFGIVGSSGVVVNMLFLYVFKEVLKIDLKYASILAIEISIIFNYFLNDFWTWNDRSKASFINRIVKYHISVMFSAYVINWGALMLLTTWLKWNYLISNLIGIGIGTVFNYVINDLWTFSKRGKKNEKE